MSQDFIDYLNQAKEANNKLSAQFQALNNNLIQTNTYLRDQSDQIKELLTKLFDKNISK